MQHAHLSVAFLLLLCCYFAATLLLLCCYFAATLLLLRTYHLVLYFSMPPSERMGRINSLAASLGAGSPHSLT
jgi:hypothetical protein